MAGRGCGCDFRSRLADEPARRHGRCVWVGEGDLIPREFRRAELHAERNRDCFALLNRQSKERFDDGV